MRAVIEINHKTDATAQVILPMDFLDIFTTFSEKSLHIYFFT